MSLCGRVNGAVFRKIWKRPETTHADKAYQKWLQGVVAQSDNLDDGYMYNCEIYQGRKNQSQYQVSFGHGPGVVLGIMDAILKGNYEVYVENFFALTKLLLDNKV